MSVEKQKRRTNIGEVRQVFDDMYIRYRTELRPHLQELAYAAAVYRHAQPGSPMYSWIYEAMCNGGFENNPHYEKLLLKDWWELDRNMRKLAHCINKVTNDFKGHAIVQIVLDRLYNCNVAIVISKEIEWELNTIWKTWNVFGKKGIPPKMIKVHKMTGYIIDLNLLQQKLTVCQMYCLKTLKNHFPETICAIHKRFSKDPKGMVNEFYTQFENATDSYTIDDHNRGNVFIKTCQVLHDMCKLMSEMPAMPPAGKRQLLNVDGYRHRALNIMGGRNYVTVSPEYTGIEGCDKIPTIDFSKMTKKELKYYFNPPELKTLTAEELLKGHDNSVENRMP